MNEHIANDKSDQKNGGWRLIERLKCIGHVDRPHEHVPALGTPAAFHKDCLNSSDGRSVLKDDKSLGKLLLGTYNSGKPYNLWELREISVAEKRQLLLKRHEFEF